MSMLTPLVTGPEVAFWLLAPVMILAALGVILSRKPVHSALCLAVVMISLAVQYAAQDAPFLFVVQIIVYTGAILMLFLFVLMLIGVDAADSLVETIRGQRVWAVVGGIGFGVLLVFAVGNAVAGDAVGLQAANSDHGGNVQGIAALLFKRYVFGFEATAALLITAALGAMVLAHRERLKAKKTQVELVAERMQRYADHGEHPGPLPSPGVFARHNGVDTPALLPDGTASELSVSATLKARGTVADINELSGPIRDRLREITGSDGGSEHQ
ncbi:MAG: NADH-quinone oxidoreductase subunit J [Microlunatus sp.]